MNKEEQTIDETIEAADTETTDDPSLQEGNVDTETSQEPSAEPSDGNSLPDENRVESQTELEPGGTSTREPPPAERESDAEYINTLASIDQHLLKLEELFTGQIARNQNQQQMFDAIYSEMKDYKENVLLEAFHKQVIHNLIQFYDNFVLVESHLNRISAPFEAFEAWSDSVSKGLFNKIRPEALADELSDFRTKLREELLQFRGNLENLRFELEEVLYRMDVTPYEEHPKKLDRKLHRTLDTKPTDNPDKDEEVETIHKIGFYWREKVFRPEEVTIFRYTQPTGEEIVDGN